MKHSWQLHLTIILSLGIVSLFVLTFASANENHNIRGLASSSLGYISFNCLDDDFFGRFTHSFEFYFNVPPCSVSQHGVHLDENNRLSGTAWSPSIGYLDFGSTSTPSAPNYNFNENCLNNTCTNANNCIACYNYNDERIYGWAYLIKDDEWIPLDSYEPPLQMSNYLAPQPGVFRNHINSPSLGPISFNCLSEGTCAIDNYKVHLWKLALQSMSAPNLSYSQACQNSGSANRVTFKWQLKSGVQTAFRIIVNTVNSTSSPVFDTGKVEGSNRAAKQLVCPGAFCLRPNLSTWTPEYNTSYYWWLQLWDEDGNPTDWFQFDERSMGVVTDNIDYNFSYNSDDYYLTFTTYRHKFPNPFYTYDPPDILVGTTTQFMSDSSFFTDANPSSNPQTCVDGNCDFLWSTSLPEEAIIMSTSSANTDIIFKNIYPQTVSLKVTDGEGYYCSYSGPVLSDINFQLPLWKEVKGK
ncbi:MAG: hypothetical protein EOM88_03785 [Clostridia bacterium]|nr:hypothetical protein [Clostridia bacterium]